MTERKDSHTINAYQMVDDYGIVLCCAERYPSDVAAAREAEFIGGARIQRITVNLETGEEVSA